MIKRALIGCLLCLFTIPLSNTLFAVEQFVTQDIRINGLQRIPVRVVYKALRINVGDEVTSNRVAQSIKSLFATGNFDDIQISRAEGDVLVIRVSERPSISGIELDGNKAIESEQLLEGLRQTGLEKGRVFRRAMLERVSLELERQYVAQGRYGAKVETKVVPQPRNRVALEIDIYEGQVASIKHINIVGNKVFDTNNLLDLFSLKPTHFWSFFKGDDKYAREKLSGDLETLRSYYMDRGYINFAIESTQVSITPDKEQVYIVVNIHEGEKFLVGDVKLTGELPIPEEELTPLLLVKPDQVFSRQVLTLTEDLIAKRLGNVGYTFSEVNGVPEAQPGGDKVDVTFFVDPGKRAYVRRIEFAGNKSTSDEVLRREMRQMEGAWASTQKIERSKVRLQQLGFFKGVKVESIRVPSTDDQVDLRFEVEEQPSGSIGASVGYQQGTGVVFGANVSQNNFLGTGNQVTFNLQRTSIRNRYNFSYLDPYFTVDGVSRGYRLYFTETDYSDDSDFSSYRTDAFGVGVNFGYPINENERLRFGFGFDNTTIFATQDSADDVREFIDYQEECFDVDVTDENGATTTTEVCDGGTQSADFDSYLSTISWRRSTLNRGLLPDRGSQNTVALEVALPGSDLEYYKLTYNGERYFPLTKKWVLRARTELGYGEGYLDTDQLPFYKHFLAGGTGSIRGFESRTLGPKEADSDTTDGLSDDPFGGNVLIEGSLEFIFPMPFVKDKRTVRSLFFIDGGNVFDIERDEEDSQNVYLDESEFRYSAGLSFSWITGIGPLTFTFAKALNDEPGDDTQFFDFSLGQFF